MENDIQTQSGAMALRIYTTVYRAVRYDVRVRLFHAAETLQEV